MPYRIVKHQGKWRILKSITGQLAKPIFKSEEAAIAQANNWIKYNERRREFRIKK